MIWPAEDSLRLLLLLGARSAARIVTTCRAASQRYGGLVPLQRKAEADPAKYQQDLEAQAAIASLELVLAEAHQALTPPASEGSSEHTQKGLMAATSTFDGALKELEKLESTLHTEMRYLYGPDWDLKPGKLISKKGTWLKKSTGFSWDVSDSDKYYLPNGISMPALQIGKVTDPVELKRHEWSRQHQRIWLKPTIIDSLEARRGVWFIYGPHWEVVGNEIVALLDTWLKRSCQMSGELAPFELIYVPKDLSVRLKCRPEAVEEEWEKFRHPHVHQHMKVTLDAAPLTVKQEKYDIFVGMSDKLYP